jgi:flavin reductase (DIM6/NTAB) family NADH-FMN oxidoreductase RutF
MDTTMNKEDIGAAIGRIPSGVFIVTAKQGDQKVGMMASWVMQAGFEPPCVSVAVHPDRELYKIIEETGRFSINVISNANMDLMKTFSKYSPNQFDEVEFEETDCGVTLPAAVAVLECKVKDKMTVTDHHVYVAEVLNGNYMNRDLEPMVHLRKSGFNY